MVSMSRKMCFVSTGQKADRLLLALLRHTHTETWTSIPHLVLIYQQVMVKSRELGLSSYVEVPDAHLDSCGFCHCGCTHRPNFVKTLAELTSPQAAIAWDENIHNGGRRWWVTGVSSWTSCSYVRRSKCPLRGRGGMCKPLLCCERARHGRLISPREGWLCFRECKR
eukprot:4606431-Amphidinium_carterae.3